MLSGLDCFANQHVSMSFWVLSIGFSFSSLATRNFVPLYFFVATNLILSQFSYKYVFAFKKKKKMKKIPKPTELNILEFMQNSSRV